MMMTRLTMIMTTTNDDYDDGGGGGGGVVMVMRTRTRTKTIVGCDGEVHDVLVLDDNSDHGDFDDGRQRK